MDFYTVREVRTTPKSLWDSLSADGSAVITSNGRPTTLMSGFLSDEEIEAEINAVRSGE